MERIVALDSFPDTALIGTVHSARFAGQPKPALTWTEPLPLVPPAHGMLHLDLMRPYRWMVAPAGILCGPTAT